MSRAGTLVGYGLIAAAIIACQVASLVTHRLPGGLHLFARSHAGG